MNRDEAIKMAEAKCKKCGTGLIEVWIGGTIPWLACPKCDSKELIEALETKGLLIQ